MINENNLENKIIDSDKGNHKKLIFYLPIISIIMVGVVILLYEPINKDQKVRIIDDSYKNNNICLVIDNKTITPNTLYILKSQEFILCIYQLIFQI